MAPLALPCRCQPPPHPFPLADVAAQVVSFGGVLSYTISMAPSFAERPLMYKERFSRTYHPALYAASVFLVELPWLVATSLLYSVIVYWMVGLLADAATFFHFFLVSARAGACRPLASFGVHSPRLRNPLSRHPAHHHRTTMGCVAATATPRSFIQGTAAEGADVHALFHLPLATVLDRCPHLPQLTIPPPFPSAWPRCRSPC